MDEPIKRHDWTKSYPRGTWPVYTCDECGIVKTPAMSDLNSYTGPGWFNEPGPGRRKLTRDDVEWLTGTGHYGQG